MSWGIAVEEQAHVRRTLQSIRTSDRLMDRYFGGHAESFGTSKKRAVNRELYDMLMAPCNGEAIWVESDIVHALMAEVDGVPDDWMLTADMMVALPAFCWLSYHPGIAMLADGLQERALGMTMPLVGFAWCEVEAIQRNSLNINMLTQSNGEVYPIAWSGWPWGETIGDRLDDLIGQQEKREPGRVAPDVQREIWGKEFRLLAALLEFMNQRIVQRERRPVERAVRRRMRIAPEHIPLVTVVTLRRRGQRRQTDPEGTNAPLSHRFVVRSHWRKQWYASSGTHRPRLIAAYVKGPEDKPLVLKRHVFDVAR